MAEGKGQRMVACNGESTMQLQARTFIATTATQGLTALAARINLNPRCEATVVTTTNSAIGQGQSTLAVFCTSPRTGYREELFVCVIYAYDVASVVFVDVLLRPGVVNGERQGMASGPLRIPGSEDMHWSELTIEHVRTYAETQFRAALARPQRPAPMRPVLWSRESWVAQAG